MSSTGRPKESRREARTAGEPFAVRQVRESAQALLAEGKVEEAFEFVVSALDAVLRKTREMELLLAKLQKQHLGKRSERVDPDQLQLLFEELCRQGGPEAAPDPEAEAREDAELEQQIEEAEQARKEQGKGGGPRGGEAKVRTGGVERRLHRREVPEAERQCALCGEAKKRIGEDVTTSLEYVPGHFVEHEYHLDKYACPKCREGVTTAEGPARVIERSTAEASLLAHVVVSKYVDHCPLHRLHNIYARSGAFVPVSTLSDWAGEVAELLKPLADELEKRVLAADVVRTDATGIKVLDPQSPQNIERGTMWCYVGDDRDVVFRYTPTGEGQRGPWEFLAGRTGYVQADAASVFDRVFNGVVAKAVEIGCWAHGRRRLIDLQEMDCRVAYPLKLIGRLYRIEHLADAKGLSVDQRASLRKQRSQGILERLKRWLVTTHASEPPSADLAKATAYILNQWEALTRFVQDGRLSLDNNLCEQQLRAIALGRRNYLFCGSHKAAEHAAVLYGLTRTCAQHGVSPLPYLTDILRKLAQNWPQSRLEELLPHRWQPAPANLG
jgi:transposase